MDNQLDEKEVAIAQEEAKKDEQTGFAYKLRKPVEYNGKKYTELHFDFDSLTGGDALDVEDEMQRQGKGTVVVAAFNSEYLIRISARACRETVGADIFRYMSMFDYNRIRDRARNFLLRAEQ